MSIVATATSGLIHLPFPAELRLRQGQFFERLACGRSLLHSTAQAAAMVVLSSAVYGATFGMWRSSLLALYVSIKLPVLLLATTSLVMLLNWLLAQVMGGGVTLAQVAALTYRSMAVARSLLLSLTPVTAFMALSCPPAVTAGDLAHNLLLLCHVVFIGCAGLYGSGTLREGLRRICRPGTPIGWLHFAWLASNALVGGQLAWILRPFLGSPNYPVAFLRPNALVGNFYEFVLVTILWKRLLGGG